MTQLVDLLNTFGAWLFKSMLRLSLELAVLAAVALVGLPTAAEPRDRTQKTAPAAAGAGQGETAMKTAGQELRYGFRYDPMQYVANDASVPAALVRA